MPQKARAMRRPAPPHVLPQLFLSISLSRVISLCCTRVSLLLAGEKERLRAEEDLTGSCSAVGAVQQNRGEILQCPNLPPSTGPVTNPKGWLLLGCAAAADLFRACTASSGRWENQDMRLQL